MPSRYISPKEEKPSVGANQCDCLKPVCKLVPNCETAHSWSYRTMLVGRLVLRWPVQSLPIWLRHLSVWMPIKDFPVLGLDGPLRSDGSGSHSPEFVGYSGRRLPHCRTPEQLCPQTVHLQSPCKEITQIVKKLPNSSVLTVVELKASNLKLEIMQRKFWKLFWSKYFNNCNYAIRYTTITNLRKNLQIKDEVVIILLLDAIMQPHCKTRWILLEYVHNETLTSHYR